MSSTNRGAKRVKNDFYETPSWCVEAILPHLPKYQTVLDPCAGQGAILRAFERHALRLRAIEINPELERVSTINWLCADALSESTLWQLPDLVLMNPPFSKAEAFVRRALDEVRGNNGTVCALLRLGFLASKKRADFLRVNPPDVYVLSKRPSFNGEGTDSCDYGWFTWGPGRGGRWFVL